MSMGKILFRFHSKDFVMTCKSLIFQEIIDVCPALFSKQFPVPVKISLQLLNEQPDQAHLFPGAL